MSGAAEELAELAEKLEFEALRGAPRELAALTLTISAARIAGEMPPGPGAAAIGRCEKAWKSTLGGYAGTACVTSPHGAQADPAGGKPAMLHDEAFPRVEAAFRRRFPSVKDVRLNSPQPGYMRASEPATGAWTDYDTSGERIRALSWNAPLPGGGTKSAGRP